MKKIQITLATFAALTLSSCDKVAQYSTFNTYSGTYHMLVDDGRRQPSQKFNDANSFELNSDGTFCLIKDGVKISQDPNTGEPLSLTLESPEKSLAYARNDWDALSTEWREKHGVKDGDIRVADVHFGNEVVEQQVIFYGDDYAVFKNFCILKKD